LNSCNKAKATVGFHKLILSGIPEQSSHFIERLTHRKVDLNLIIRKGVNSINGAWSYDLKANVYTCPDWPNVHFTCGSLPGVGGEVYLELSIGEKLVVTTAGILTKAGSDIHITLNAMITPKDGGLRLYRPSVGMLVIRRCSL